MPLPAALGPPGSRVVPEPEGQTSAGATQLRIVTQELGGFGRSCLAREPAILAEPLLQQQQHECQQTDGAGGSPSADGVSKRVESIRAQCVEAFGAAVEKEKAKVASFFSERRTH